MGADPCTSRLPQATISPPCPSHFGIPLANYWGHLKDECLDTHPTFEETSSLSRGVPTSDFVSHATPSCPVKKVHLDSNPPTVFEPSPSITTVDSNISKADFFGTLKDKPSRSIPKCSKLKVRVTVTFADGSTRNLLALVDTGAEISLINPNLIDPSLFFPSPKPLRLGVANSNTMVGGKRQVNMLLSFQGRDLDTGHIQELLLPISEYDADIVCDLILSYTWLAENNIVPNPRRHGLHFMEHPGPAWVSGVIAPKTQGITVLEKLPIESQPASPHHAQSPPLQETQLHQWERHETVTYLTQLHLHAQVHHPHMAIPDLPGLADHVPPDPLVEEDLHSIAQAIQDTHSINYIKGFVQSGEKMEGPDVDALRDSVLKDYASTVFFR